MLVRWLTIWLGVIIYPLTRWRVEMIIIPVLFTLLRPGHKLIRIRPIWHTWLDKVMKCRVGVIWINICPSLNIMNKTGIIIIFSLHRVSGDTTPSSHIINNLTNIQLQYSFFWTTNRRTTWLGKEDGSLRRARAANSRSKRLEIPTKISNPRSLLHFSCPATRRRTYWLWKEYGIHGSVPKWFLQ